MQIKKDENYVYKFMENMIEEVDNWDYVYYRWPRSTYRPTIDRYIGRLSVGNRPTIVR